MQGSCQHDGEKRLVGRVALAKGLWSVSSWRKLPGCLPGGPGPHPAASESYVRARLTYFLQVILSMTFCASVKAKQRNSQANKSRSFLHRVSCRPFLSSSPGCLGLFNKSSHFRQPLLFCSPFAKWMH